MLSDSNPSGYQCMNLTNQTQYGGNLWAKYKSYEAWVVYGSGTGSHSRHHLGFFAVAAEVALKVAHFCAANDQH